LFDDSEDIFVIAFFADFQADGIDIIFLGKTHASLSRLAVFVQGFIGGRTFDEVFAVGLPGGERGYRNNEPPRGSEDADVFVVQVKFVEK
jgi:hypothetical protein